VTRLLVGLALLGLVACSRTPQAASRSRASFAFDIRDTKGRPIPARITLVPVGGTAELKLSATDAVDLRGRMLVAGNKIMTLDGQGELDVPHGHYHAYVSRGIEWTVTITPVGIGSAGFTLRTQLDHVIDTTGWLSGDFHVHASPSWDSHVPLSHRVIEFVTSGVDLIVSTDHNMIADYAPTIAELGVEKYLDSMIGDEVTTLHKGHFGVYPIAASQVGKPYGSQWRHQGDGADIFPAIRRDHPGAIIQVNHPRSHDWMGYFRDEHYSRQAGRALVPGFSLDFDTIEVLNTRALDPVDGVLEDWFSMLDHGHVVTAMGNSDTHDMHSGLGGYPRNYMRVPDDRAGKVSNKDIVDALRGHHSFFTTGPIIDLRSGNAGIGDVVPAPDGRVTLSIEVSAAPWIGVESATLYVNGKVEKRWAIAPSKLPQRLDVQHSIVVSEDSYVVLRADGKQSMWPVAGNTELYQIVPIAITNPLFVDRDGDGRIRTTQL
jgi:hypothetical protein